MTVIEFALSKMYEESDDENLVRYWSAYKDGAEAQKREDERTDKDQ